ncbi:hypothetical protein GCM10009000_002100 [Halobacterium noricense]
MVAGGAAVAGWTVAGGWAVDAVAVERRRTVRTALSSRHDGPNVSEPEESTKRTRPCPYCGASMVHRHCEYVCPQHGVVFDCSDPFYG